MSFWGAGATRSRGSGARCSAPSPSSAFPICWRACSTCTWSGARPGRAFWPSPGATRSARCRSCFPERRGREDMETQTLPVLPETAPFSAAQRAWLNGLLAGMYSQTAAQAGAAAQADAEPALILFGSQSGTCETLARRFAAALKKSGHEATVVDMAHCDVTRLAAAGLVLIITSTYGEGDPPDNARALHRGLHADDAPRL